MNNTASAKRRTAAILASALFGMSAVLCQAAPTLKEIHMTTQQNTSTDALSVRQQAIVPIAAFAASGDMARLNAALNDGLDAGLTVSEAKEVLIQVVAYAGFPRSLNALGECMKVLEARQQRGVHDPAGHAPSRPIPVGAALLAVGGANQTRLAGAPVKGALFDFAPAIDAYLKTHLFGDIFERDNLDWQSRELATLAMLSALPGAESQLQSHVRISMNVGITAPQLQQLVPLLQARVSADNATRMRTVLQQTLDPSSSH
jgi:alkylhydroperoxidase/carboxymuconolactone decarboxylase family protein YurZ